MWLDAAIINISTPVSTSLIAIFTAWYSGRSNRSPPFVFLSTLAVFHMLRAVLASNASSRRKKQDAERLGGRIIPKVKGKWPGNFDVLLEMVRSESEGYPGEIFARWCEEYGPTFDMGILWGSQMVTADPDVIKQIVSSQFTSFEKSEKWNRMSYDFLGDGIFSTDGPTWKHHRSVARPFFAQDRISDFECFKRHVDVLLDVLTTQATTSKAFDLQDIFRRLTLDITTDFLFGTAVNSLRSYSDPSALEHADFSKAFDEISNVLATRVRQCVIISPEEPIMIQIEFNLGIIEELPGTPILNTKETR
ncbi:hypothetical protein FRC02_010408 [Tulasnella sp. 418]|nr:hypothetical protein FRC02_010408 [Tulasnella sp. 418]